MSCMNLAINKFVTKLMSKILATTSKKTGIEFLDSDVFNIMVIFTNFCTAEYLGTLRTDSSSSNAH